MANEIKKLLIETGGKEYELGGGGSTPAADSVGSKELQDNSVQMEDLNDKVKEKIQKTYDESDETLYMDFDMKGGAVTPADEEGSDFNFD